ncbi:MAG TPA: hypothetical protein VLQ67_14120 [Arachnia sp.]|nr:hypothetical protein [Arachnia sp.]
MFARIRPAKLGGFVAAITSPAGHDCLRDPGQPGGPSGVRAASEQLSHASLNPKQDVTGFA